MSRCLVANDAVLAALCSTIGLSRLCRIVSLWSNTCGASPKRIKRTWLKHWYGFERKYTNPLVSWRAYFLRDATSSVALTLRWSCRYYSTCPGRLCRWAWRWPEVVVLAVRIRNQCESVLKCPPAALYSCKINCLVGKGDLIKWLTFWSTSHRFHSIQNHEDSFCQLKSCNRMHF